MTSARRNVFGAVSGALIGTLGGLIGLGGAEFRLPLLIALFRLPTLEAVILNKAVSLVVVAAALPLRTATISFTTVAGHFDVVLNLLAGSLLGAWWAAGHAMSLSRRWLNRIVMVLLVGLSLAMIAEAWIGLHSANAALVESGWQQLFAGFAAGLAIGMLAALLGVAGGELLIPTIVLLYGLDIKVAGSLSLLVSLPTMIVGFARYSQADAFAVLRRERSLGSSMALGSVLGAGVGAALLGVVPARALMAALAVILLVSAVKTFQHVR